MIIKVVEMDITKMGNLVDVIVNAANESLLGGGGVDGAIHQAAGPLLLKECEKLNGCEPGNAKATKAYNLPQKYIIHTVGPRYYSDPNPAKTLKSCYQKTLELADSLGCEGIAFPSISTGIFGYPVEEASKICAETIFAFKGKKLRYAYLCVLPGQKQIALAYDKAFMKEYPKYF